MDWNWDDVYKNAMRCGIRPEEFWDLTPKEYNLIVEAYEEQQREVLFRDIRNAYYTGCFAQVEKPKELYDRIIASIEAKPQSAEEMFGFLKSMATRGKTSEDILESHFNIPLKLTPEFDVGIFHYICLMEAETITLYLLDVHLSLNSVLLKPENGMYTLGPGMVKIKYNDRVYTIVMIRS
jgi:hypothetical protein